MTVPSRALLVKYVAAVLALIGLSVVIMAGVVPAGPRRPRRSGLPLPV